MGKILIGHHLDNDGILSYQVARRYYLQKNPHAFCKGVWLTRSSDNKKFMDEIDPNDVVLILDFSFEPEVMAEIKKKVGGRFILIDHHRTCWEQCDKAGFEYEGYVSGPDEDPVAACQLCWMYFFPNEPMPEIIKACGNYDVWQFPKNINQIADEVLINFGTDVIMRSMGWEQKQQLWDALLANDSNAFNQVKMVGYYWVKNEMKVAEIAYKSAPIVTIEGQKFKMVSNSVKADILSYWGECKMNEQFPDSMLPVIVFGQTNKGSWSFSVRDCGSKIDCGRFAEMFGGGGHECSAGFILSWADFMEFAKLYKFDAIGAPIEE